MAPRAGSLLLVTSLALASLHCADECTTDSDCPSDQLCSSAKCRQKVNPPPPPPPAGDGGVQDAGGDAGPSADATNPDAAPDAGGGNLDAQTSDALVIDSAVVALANSAQIVAAEFVSTPAPIVDVYAELVDRSAATYVVSEQRFPDGEGNDCILRSSRLSGGVEGAIPARLVRLAKGADIRELVPLGSKPWRFESSTAWTVNFVSMDEIVASFVSTGAIGGVSDQTFPPLVGPESLFPSQPPLGQGISLRAPLVLAWSSVTSGGLVLEVFDEARNVVLRCAPIANDGLYAVPRAATDAWLAVATAGIRWAELRIDTEQSVSSTLTGVAAALPTSIRLSHGVRYPVQ